MQSNELRNVYALVGKELGQMPGPSLLGSLDLSVFNTEGAPPVGKPSETVEDSTPGIPLPSVDVG